MKRTVFTVLLFVSLSAGLAVGCAKARHVAVQIDATVASAVFAVDDAELAACQAQLLKAEDCDKLNPMIKSALQDVKALTAALQATPKDGEVPKTLPALIQTLRSVQMVALALPPSDATNRVVSRVNTALDAAIGLLSKIAGN